MSDPLVELASLRAQVAQLNAFAAQQQQQQQQHNAQHIAARPPRIDLPKIRQPSTFAGVMGFAVDDWIGEMEQQFAYYGNKFATDVIKIEYAVAFFSGPAMHWWDHETDRDGLDWTGFVRRLHGRFRPVQAAMFATSQLRTPFTNNIHLFNKRLPFNPFHSPMYFNTFPFIFALFPFYFRRFSISLVFLQNRCLALRFALALSSHSSNTEKLSTYN